jgi:stage II sporulation protein D
MDAVTFRQRLGYTQLKSLRFDIKQAGSSWAVSGAGFGHGAGLCQWGSRLYADKGWEFGKILAHYYPGTELQKLYE